MEFGLRIVECRVRENLGTFFTIYTNAGVVLGTLMVLLHSGGRRRNNFSRLIDRSHYLPVTKHKNKSEFFDIFSSISNKMLDNYAFQYYAKWRNRF